MMSAKIRQYTTAIAATTDVLDIELSCLVCETNNGCGTPKTYASATHTYEYNSSITATFKQNTSSTQPFLGIQYATHEPSVNGAYGRFYFKPVTAAPSKLYNGSSVLSYTIGNLAFAATSRCQIKTKVNNAPGVHSDAASKCEISGSVVTITAGKDAATSNFMVEILNGGAFTFTSAAITGTLTNFGTAVESFDSTTGNEVNLTAATQASPATTTITLTKTFVNTMDIAKFSFAVTLGEIAAWDKTGKALITFPSYYPAHLGEGIRCNLKLTDSTEPLYCALKWDWTLEVWGPRTNA